MMSPPSPPSPRDGPPRGTYFSRRKAMQPLPPSPAFTRIVASSININYCSPVTPRVPVVEALVVPGNKKASTRRRGSLHLWRGHPRPRDKRQSLLRGDRLNHHVFAQLSAILKPDAARDLGKQSIVLAPTHVQPRFHARAALPHDNGAAWNQLSAKSFKAQPLRVRIAPVS